MNVTGGGLSVRLGGLCASDREFTGALVQVYRSVYCSSLVAECIRVSDIHVYRVIDMLLLHRSTVVLSTNARRQASRAGVCAPPLVAVAYGSYIILQGALPGRVSSP